MFCDLAGSTELSGRLDPEEMHELIIRYHRCCKELIERVGGFVAKYLGDGTLAYFGYPQAHENDPERAIRAALAVTQAVPRLDAPNGEPLAVRIGIATGLVVVGDLIGEGWSQERAVAGDAPNLAARLQAMATPNGVMVSALTRRLAGHLFTYRDLDSVVLKGIAKPEHVWEVVGVNNGGSNAGRTAGLAPMVGRDRELEIILEIWKRRAAGEGHIVGIAGDAGIGKSRLVHEVHRRIAKSPHVWIEAEGAQLSQNTPFHALSQSIRRLFERQGCHSSEQRAEALQRALAQADMNAEDAVPLIAELMNVPTADSSAPLTLGTEERRSRLIGTLAQWLLNTAERWPTALVIEDIHWADPSSLETLDRLAHAIPGVPLLLIYTVRTGHAPPWPPGPAHTCINLDRLGGDSIRAIAQRAAHQPLNADLVQTILSRADGVPLFAQELAHLLATGEDGAADREIPETLSDLLTARLDELGDAKQVAQTASILGQEFSFALLAAVADIDKGKLRNVLQSLVDAQILVARGGWSGEVYSFRHALLEDAAYGMLLRRQRRELHRRAATAIVERFPAMAAERPETLARHWTEAGDLQPAIAAWRNAGDAATRRGALKEAESHYQTAISLVQRLPPSRDRDELEFRMQNGLAAVLQLADGYSAPRTVAVIARARTLANSSGALSDRLRLAVQEWMVATSAGEYDSARNMADQILALARPDGTATRLAHAYMIQMTSRYRVGDIIGAEDAFRCGMPYFTDDFWRKPGTVAQTLANAAWIAWTIADSAEARRRMDSAITISIETKRPYDLAVAQAMSGCLSLFDSDFTTAAALARKSIQLCTEHGFSQIEPQSQIVMGRIRAANGEPRDGIALIRNGIRAMAEARARVCATMHFTWLAEAQALDGSLHEALETINEALLVNPQEQFFRPETLRVRGELLRAMSRIEEAEISIRESMALAKRMGARFFHQKSAESLSQLRGTS